MGINTDGIISLTGHIKVLTVLSSVTFQKLASQNTTATQKEKGVQKCSNNLEMVEIKH